MIYLKALEFGATTFLFISYYFGGVGGLPSDEEEAHSCTIVVATTARTAVNGDGRP